MAKKIDEILYNQVNEGKNTEDIQAKSDMISKLCEKYGVDVATNIVSSTMNEDTEFTEVSEEDKPADVDMSQNNQNNQNTQQNQQNNQNNQNQQNTVVPIPDKMVSDFDNIVKQITTFQSNYKGTVAEQAITNLVNMVNSFKTNLQQQLDKQKQQSNQNNQNTQQNNQNNQNTQQNNQNQQNTNQNQQNNQ